MHHPVKPRKPKRHVPKRTGTKHPKHSTPGPGHHPTRVSPHHSTPGRKTHTPRTPVRPCFEPRPEPDTVPDPVMTNGLTC